MPKSGQSLSLSDAKMMLAAAEIKANEIGIPYNIAVVDSSGFLIVFSRQDGALIGCIDLAIQKAFTSCVFNIATADLADVVLPGQPLYGIQASNNGKIAIFGGGIPIRRGGAVIGAVGTSAGTIEQDIEVAAAGYQALDVEPTR